MGTFRSVAQVPQWQHNRDRLRRADSWRQRSEAATSDTDRFIFLWIAFNAAYGFELPRYDHSVQPKEYDKFTRFCYEIVKRDEETEMQKILCKTFRDQACSLLNNRFVYGPFWEWIWGRHEAGDWKNRFDRRNKEAQKYLNKEDVSRLLEIALERLYTLRNQIFHGGATYAVGWGQKQVRDGAALMAAIVPAILEIMRREIAENPDSEVWGKVLYPRIGEERL